MYVACKRGLDLLVAIVGLFLSAPLMLAVAILVRCSMGRPILFRQERPGRGGRPFGIYKFRTMRESGQASNDSERLTPLGRWLRATSLDELPQLWNVLCGELSLVGPRPLLMEYLPLYTAEQQRRHDVMPGITGWAQINGRNAISWEEKFAHDVWYVDNRSMMLDMRIMTSTVLNVLLRRGISQASHVTMEKFRGSTGG